MTSPLISVIVPVINSEDTIEQCLQSVIEQTFTSFEVLVIDDGSTDSTMKIVSDLKLTDERITYITKPNEGPGVARNFGLERAKGEWIYCLDSDDYLEPHFFEEFAAAIRDDVDVVLTSFSTYNDKCKCKFPAPWSNRYTDVFKDDGETLFTWEIEPDIFFEMVQNIPWNKVVRKSLLDEWDIKFLDTYLSEDMSYSIKACVMARNIARLGNSNVVHREYTGTSAMDLKNEHALDFLVALDDLRKWLTQEGLFLDLRAAFDRWTLNACLYNLTTHNDEVALQSQVEAICTEYFGLFAQYQSDYRNALFEGLSEDHKELAQCLYGRDLNQEDLLYIVKDLRNLNRLEDRARRQKLLSPLFRSKKIYEMVEGLMKRRRMASK